MGGTMKFQQVESWGIRGGARCLIGLCIAIGLLLPCSEVRADLLAKWTFPDQGATSQASLSASSVHPAAVAGAIQMGSGYTQLVQIVSSTKYSYIDSAQNGGWATLASGAAADTTHKFYMVGDWNDGVTGGNIVASNTTFTNNPSGAGPAGAGCLYVSTPPGLITDTNEVVQYNLGITFSLTASGGNLVVTNFSFYGTRDGADSTRSWQKWWLQVDTGAGFTHLFSSADNAIPATESWGLTKTTLLNVSIPSGSTATFRLLGTSTDTSIYGRETAFDDLTLQGTVESPPLVSSPSSLSPTNNATVPAPSTLSITFTEAVTNGAGNITITNLTDSAGTSFAANDGQVSGLGTATITITPSPALANSKHYAVLIDTNAFKNTAGLYFAGHTNTTTWDWSFHTAAPDTTAPTTNSLSPADNATQVVATNNLNITFSEDVLANGAGRIIVTNLTAGSATNFPATNSNVSINGASVRITSLTFTGSTDYAVLIETNAFRDAAGNYFAGITSDTGWNFRTDDIVPTVAPGGFSPADNATGVSVGSSFVVTFSENVLAGSGNIVITNLTDGTGTVTIAVTDSSQVTVSGTTVTVNPTNYLSYGKSYAVKIASGAVRDISGNAYAGISDVSTWNVATPQEAVMLAQWTFADPSPATAANYSPATVAAGVLVPAITNGSGVTRYATYNGTLDNSLSYLRHASSGVNGFVPTVSGSVSGGAFLDFAMRADHVNDLAEAISGNRYVQIDVTGNGAHVTINEIRFYAQQSTETPDRCVDKGQWRVDTGSGYANWGEEMTFALSPYELERTTGPAIVITNRTTVSFRFYGYMANNDPYGRTLAMDDLTFWGSMEMVQGSIFRLR